MSDVSSFAMTHYTSASGGKPLSNLTLSSSCYTDSESISVATDELPFLPSHAQDLTLEKLSDEESLLTKHGYTRHEPKRKTNQGELFIAKSKNNDYVAIKKVSKYLHSRHEAHEDGGFTFIVDEDIVKEAFILRHLTVNNKPIGDTIIQYIDSFESDSHFYLVMEYISSDINLKEFVVRCHSLIRDGRLRLFEYQQIIKYILWQLIATLHWLHCDMHCSHLDLFAENIMLNNVHFAHHRDGNISINPGIRIKIVDFGVSEIFDAGSFACNKQHLSLDNEAYLAPNIYKQGYYNAAAADMWSFGMLVYFCFVGNYPYKIIQETDFNEAVDTKGLNNTGYWSICNNSLITHLQTHSLLKFINIKSLSLINGLLSVDECKRLQTMDVLQHPLFCSYFQRYSLQISKKSIHQRRESLKLNQIIKNVNLK